MHLLILWHFHQPYYAQPGSEVFDLPWVRLHSAKSYLDMAAVLNRHPSFRCTANFSGVLLEQLMRYTDDGWRDTYWDLTLKSPASLDEDDYQRITRSFFSLSHESVVPRFPRYRELLAVREAGTGLDEQQILDLQVLFNLAWCGFTIRDNDPRAAALMAKERGFAPEDRDLVLQIHLDAMRDVASRWRALVASGQVELSATPLYHPILPLLIDSQAARRCMPEAPLPSRFCFPEDASDHVEMGLDVAEQYFGARPLGIWPSEGSVSPELISIAREKGIEWLATDEGILHRSNIDTPRDDGYVNRGWSLGGDTPTIFFRDHELSDLVGFSYSKSHPEEAVADFLHRLRARSDGHKDTCVSVILDGENAWEHYPDDAKVFLETLHSRLTEATDVSLTTPTAYRAEGHRSRRIRALATGSWVDADFRIWIGSKETNQAWEQLLRARALLHENAPAMEEDKLARARRYIMRAEGSDWMWWYGDDFQSMEDDLFDKLFRENLAAVYEELGRSVPSALLHPIGEQARPAAPWPPRGQISPAIDGRAGGYLKWLGAGTLPVRTPGGTMAQTSHYFSQVRYGFDDDNFYLRACVQLGVQPTEENTLDFGLEVECGERPRLFRVAATRGGPCELVDLETRESVAGSVALFVDCLELSIPLIVLPMAGGDHVQISLSVSCDGVELERLPRQGSFILKMIEDWPWFV